MLSEINTCKMNCHKRKAEKKDRRKKRQSSMLLVVGKVLETALLSWLAFCRGGAHLSSPLLLYFSQPSKNSGTSSTARLGC